MSDVPQEDPTKKKKKPKNDSKPLVDAADDFWSRYGKLPPAPEDKLVLAGDMLSLFVYGFFDHFICQDMASLMLHQAVNDSPQKLARAAEQAVLGTPVWLPTSAQYKDHVLYHVILSDKTVTHYSPLLQPMGLATCLLAACWLLAGWLHSAFSYRNTLDCKTERALTVTLYSWMTTCVLMMAIVGASHDPIHGNGFTRGDVDYVFDSLTVLVMWRFMASYLLGSGSDDE